MSRLHPVFNVIKLQPTPEDPIPGCRSKPPLPPELINNEEYYEVEEILDSRRFRGKIQFKVKWKGYGYEEHSWEPREYVNADKLVKEFYRLHPDAPKHIRGVYFLQPPHKLPAKNTYAS